jgi:hypothetical protein
MYPVCTEWVPNYPLQRTSGLALLALRPLSGTFGD